jgi:hypothetical protein
MKTGMAVIMAAMLTYSAAYAANPHVEPCHAVLLHFPTAIKKVVPADPDLVDIVATSANEIVLSAKRGKEDTTRTSGAETITTSRSFCQQGATTVVAFDDSGNKITPDRIDYELSEVLVAFPPRPGRTVNVNETFYWYCEPDRLCEKVR